MNKILALCFFCVVFVATAQDTCENSIKGKILDLDTKEPLPFATVKINDSSKGVITEADGSFYIANICEDEVDLEVRFVGYKTVVHHHDLHHASPTIYLASDGTLLEGVVVEESLNQHDLHSIEAKTINVQAIDRIGKSAGDLLEKSSGVSVLKTGQNIVKPIIHGLHSNRVLIINNGVRHSYQAWGREHAPEIEGSQIDQIQVVKGASTVRYGSEAMGGVILFDAPQASYDEALNGELVTGYQTNGRGFGGEFRLNKGFKRAAFTASVSGNKNGDLRTADYSLTNTGKEEFGYSMGGKFHFPKVDLSFYANHFSQELGILRSSVNGSLEDLVDAINASEPDIVDPFAYNINTPRQETIHDLVKTKASFFLGEHQFDLQYAFQSNDRREFDIRRGTNNERPAINLRLNTHTVDFDWDHPSSGIWEGTYGMQWYAQNNDNIPGTNTIPFIPNYNITSFGIFGIESYDAGNITYEIGARFDFLNMNVRGRDARNDIFRDELNYQNLTLTIGFVKPLNDFWSIRSNIGTAWRAPNVNELYAFGKHQSRIEYGLYRYQLFPEQDSISARQVISSEMQKAPAERGLKWIGTLNFQKKTVQMEITPYLSYINNFYFMRAYDLTNTVRGAFPYFITDRTTAIYSGVDFDLKKNWKKDWMTEVKLSYLFAKDVERDQFFIEIPPFNMQALVSKEISNFKVDFSGEWSLRPRNVPPTISPDELLLNKQGIDRNANFDFTDAPSGYFLLNSAISYQIAKATFKISGSNLLNVSYRRYTDSNRYFADDLGLNIQIHAALKF